MMIKYYVKKHDKKDYKYVREERVAKAIQLIVGASRVVNTKGQTRLSGPMIEGLTLLGHTFQQVVTPEEE